MDFNDFVKFIRKDGCRVFVYKNKTTVDGDFAYFVCNSGGKPYICIATKGATPLSKVEMLAHEYGHYLQYKEEGPQWSEGLDIWSIFQKWANGKDYDDDTLSKCRRLMLISEWDASMRGIEVVNSLDVKPWDEDSMLCYTAAYISSIKWGWQTRNTFNYTAGHWRFKPKAYSIDEVLQPLTVAEFKKIDKWMRAENKLPKGF